jgi:hypothetical protein
MRVTMRHSVTNMPDTLTHTDAQTHTMHHARVYSSTSIVGINRSLVQTIMYSRCLADSLPPPCVLYFPASASAADGPHLLFVAQKGARCFRLQASVMRTMPLEEGCGLEGGLS